jgi:hypothetical protein
MSRIIEAFVDQVVVYCSDFNRVEEATTRLACLAIMLVTAEWLRVRKLFGTAACSLMLSVGTRAPSNVILRLPGMSIVIGLADSASVLLARLAAAIYVAYTPNGYGSTLALGFVVGSLLAWNIKRKVANDGADQLMMLVAISILVGRVGVYLGASAEVALHFVSAQACLSYCVAGVAKCFGKEWRNGTALPAILTTAGFGVPSLRSIVERSQFINLLLSWSVIVGECLFPVLLLTDPHVAVRALFFALAFHFTNAVLMGLNNFAIAFASTYPCVLYTCVRVNGVLIEWFDAAGQ